MNGASGSPSQPEPSQEPDSVGEPIPPEPIPSTVPAANPNVDFLDTPDTAPDTNATDTGSVAVQPGRSLRQALAGGSWGWLLPIGLIVAMIAAAIWLYTALAFSWGTAVAQRQITLVSDPFQPVILHNGVYIETPLALSDGSAFFVGSLDAGTPASLISLDLATGSINWTAEAQPWQYPVAVPGILFIEEDEGFAGRVKALSTISGTEIWVRDFRLLGGNNINYMAAIDDQLSVRLQDDIFGTYYLISQEDGRTVQQKRTDSDDVFFIDRDPLRVYEARPGSVRVSSRAGWQADVPGFNLQPQVLDNIILVQYTPYDSPFDALMALDRQSGAVLWQRSDPVVSNTAVAHVGLADATAFTLAEREGGTQLIAISLSSGEMVGSVLFTTNSAAAESAAFVAADANQVAAYFGDARQLFVFNWVETAVQPR